MSQFGQQLGATPLHSAQSDVVLRPRVLPLLRRIQSVSAGHPVSCPVDPSELHRKQTSRGVKVLMPIHKLAVFRIRPIINPLPHTFACFDGQSSRASTHQNGDRVLSCIRKRLGSKLVLGFYDLISVSLR